MNSVRGNAADYVKDGVRVFLVLDFDGVFNSFYTCGTFGKSFFNPDVRIRIPNANYNSHSSRRELETYAGRRHSKEPKTYALQWSSEIVKNFNKLLKDPRIQVVWLTTWREDMGDVVYRMGLKSKREMVYLPWGAGSKNKGDQAWKSIALSDFMAGVNTGSKSDEPGAHLVWVEDYVLDKSRLDWRNDLPAPEFDDTTSLLIAPNEDYGISREEFAAIESFVTKALANC